jgi:hypothetical protein
VYWQLYGFGDAGKVFDPPSRVDTVIVLEADLV